MPLGSFRLNSLGKFIVTATAEVIRSKKGITAVGNAQVSTAQSKFGGSSAAFDGGNDWLLADDLVLGTNDFTIECWINRLGNGAVDPNMGIVDYRTSVSNVGPLFNARAVSGDIVVGLFVSGSYRITSNIISNNQWIHVALVRSGNEHRLYMNGVQEGVTWTSTSDYVNSLATIGAYNFNSVSGDDKRSWNGYIDEFRISNTARYTANFIPQTQSFVNDENTLLLIHADGTNASTYFEDDNGVPAINWSGRAPNIVTVVGDSKISTVESKFGQSSAYFDGTGDYLAIANIPGFIAANTDITSECWVYFPTTVPINRGIIQLGTVSPTQSNLGTLTMVVNGTGGWRVQANDTTTNVSSTVAADTWYHVALVKTINSTVFYVNGQALLTLSTTNTAYTATDSITIGGYWSTSFLMTGYIDEVRVSTSARYTTNFTPASASFVNDANTLLLLHMEGENSSTVFIDDVGTGRVKKGVSALGNAQVSTAQSKFGGSSALFDGSGDYLRMDPLLLGTGQITIEAWVRTTGSGTNQNVIGGFVGSSGFVGWILDVASTGGARVRFGTTNVVSSITVNDGNWHHLAGVRDGTNCRLYIDGVQVSTGTTNSENLTLSAETRIGSLSTSFLNYFTGHIDEIRISNTARYTANFTAPTAPFVNDGNTLLLIHADGTNASTVFEDDNGVRSKIGISAFGTAQISTAQSKFGGSSLFNSISGDYVDCNITHIRSLSNGTTFTIEGWINFSQLPETPAAGYTINLGTSNSNYIMFRNNRAQIAVNNSFFNYYYDNNDGTGFNLTTNTWYHWAAVKESSNEWFFYLNGNKISTFSASAVKDSNWLSNDILRIGRYFGDNRGLLFGYQDEIRISNTARYTTNFTPSTTPFQNDSNTLLLLHTDGTNASKVLVDDNGVTPNWEY
jgi:hypothetical protein